MCYIKFDILLIDINYRYFTIKHNLLTSIIDTIIYTDIKICDIRVVLKSFFSINVAKI